MGKESIIRMRAYHRRQPTLLLSLLIACVVFPTTSFGHGERAQQANTRMRTINWYDIDISPASVAVGELVTVKGRFRPSKRWPRQIPSLDGKVFLNVGTGGPNFVRLDSNIDGISAIQSTTLELGKDYSFDMTLKARRPGRFHVHPILNVLDAGGMVGPGRWVEITGSQADFENKVGTMFGREVNLENYGLANILAWHIVWFVIGGAWVFYWIRKRPLLVSRFRAVEEVNARGDDPDELISRRDITAAAIFLTVTLVVIVISFAVGERNAPITIPLRTAETEMPDDKPYPDSNVKVKIQEASYRIPGRSFKMRLSVENSGDTPLEVSEFLTANVRFINPSVKTVTPLDEHDLVASNGLRVEGGAVNPGETKILEVFAEDALWETQRLTRMINDPDSIIAGLLFFRGENDSREIVEVAGSLLPIFH